MLLLTYLKKDFGRNSSVQINQDKGIKTYHAVKTSVLQL